MAKIESDVVVYCDECGDDLDVEVKYGDQLYVSHCERCLEKEKDTSYDDGYSLGYSEGEAACEECDD